MPSTALVTHEKGHVSVDVVTMRLPGVVRAAVEFVVNLLAFAYLCFVVWRMFLRAGELYAKADYTPIWYIPLWPVAVAMAGQLVAVTPKKVGRSVRAGQSCATIESGKWGGPAKTAADGEIVAVNDAVVAQPNTVNAEPYGAGWLLILKPEKWDEAKAKLTPGSAVAPLYEAKMAADGFAGCGG